jgi:hypothetical protein
LPAVRIERCGKEIVTVGGRQVDRVYPAGSGEFGSPDDVELEDIGIGRPGVQPLHVQLVALIGGVGCHAELDRHVRMQRFEPRQLRADDGALGAHRASREGQPRSRLAAPDRKEGETDREQTIAHRQ